MATQEELAEIKSNALALRKIADQVLLQVERLEITASSERPIKKRKLRPVKYTAMILGGQRATKKNIKDLT